VQVIEPDRKAFKAALAKGSFYKDLRSRFGDEAWKLLQASAGEVG
jgi:TRAP-type transport system periplasmic protein